MEFNQVYFWTDTIKDWKHLLKQDKYKHIIIDIWADLVNKKLIKVYAFVIMPNHIHVIWKLLTYNGKEMPHASFNKNTAHLFVKDLKAQHPQVLPYFAVSDKERSYRIWQREPLAILLDNKSKLEQKLDYLHNNPLHQRWNLALRPELYIWSSADFYENNNKKFDFITHYGELYD
jgi:REP element-mobilizing transposase RayT